MADDKILYDDAGYVRQFIADRSDETPMAEDAAADAAAPTPQEAAQNFLMAHAELFQLPQDSMMALDANPTAGPVPEAQALRFESEKAQMDTTTVSYNQTMYGLPIYQAGISVTTQGPANSVTAANSTLHYDVAVEAPSDALADQPLNAASEGGYDDLVRRAIPAAEGMRINGTSLMVYRYEEAKRLESHPHEGDGVGFASEPPTLPLPDVPGSISEGTHYIVVDALFSYPLADWGMMNWRAFIAVDSGAVLYLRALVDGVTGLVFDRDPITKSGNAANGSGATAAVLDGQRDNVTLPDLGPAINGVQKLSGTFVKISEVTLPNVAAPTTASPFNFAYGARTNNFSAVNAYYHCDRFFRMVRDLGFTIATYFDGTSFPVPIDHRGKGTAQDQGNIVNADCRGNAASNGIGSVNFALANVGDTAHPIGIATDPRVVLHEIGGHGILWDHVNSPNFGFAHSAGDSIAAIFHDPDTHAPDRFLTFPFPISASTGQPLDRRHDRPVNGWGWGSGNDNGGYGSEQLLSTCHFRLYRSIGGDSPHLGNRIFASRAAIYLILRGVGQLTPATNSQNALAWEQQLETADAGTWTSTSPAETNSGGAYHKVIRWAFEKQGLFRAPGAPVTSAGVAPAVDVYIDDGRHGEYQFLANHWSCTDIWNRTSVGAGGGVHQEPVTGQTNFAYVRIKNRGTQAATGIKVKGFHANPGAGLVFPTDWAPMATPVLSAPNLAANDAVGEVVGPFKWVPSQVGHECMFFSVSATGDASNIDGSTLTGPIQEWRLVPNDNNIAQRNVHPIKGALADFKWENLPFFIRNNQRRAVRLGIQVQIPKALERAGWKFEIPSISRERVVIKAGEQHRAVIAMTKGKAVDPALLRKAKDNYIVVTILHDGIAVGGMTYEIVGTEAKTR